MRRRCLPLVPAVSAGRMDALLFLCHRLPLPPDRGDRIRLTHVLRHLAARHSVYLGCLIDAPDPEPQLAALRGICARVVAVPAHPAARALRALAHAVQGGALSAGWFAHPALTRLIAETAALRPVASYVFGATMFRPGLPGRVILDMVECDSEKWDARAERAPALHAALWRHEAARLRALEASGAGAAATTLFAAAADAEAFAARHPALAPRIVTMTNGVDADWFDPARGFPCPFAGPGPHLVFTASFDYWPNEAAARWFVAEVMPRLRGRGAVLHLVGAGPGVALRRLARPGEVVVTGRVPDIRPYLAHADVVVAPLRWARGVQNKVLEALAMARPVVASGAAARGIAAVPGREWLVADDARAMADAIGAVLDGAHPGLGAAGRARMLGGFGWAAGLTVLDAVLSGPRSPTGVGSTSDERASMLRP